MASANPEKIIPKTHALLDIQWSGRSFVLTYRTAYVLIAAITVYGVSQWNALTNQYWLMDDVRQQVYWMQSWVDPELYRDDVLSRYARDYVPWGVQAVYYIGSFVMNPLQFTKVVALALYVCTMGFLYGLGKGFDDDFTAVVIVCVCFFFPGFMTKISGGLSQGFAYPLLASYLYFVSLNKGFAASCVILIQSVFNPYIFTLCLATHCLFVLHHDFMPRFRNRSSGGPPKLNEYRKIFAQNIPVIAGCLLILLKYMALQSPEFGDIVTWKDMLGNPEYSELGRTDDLPPPSIFWELFVPWTYFFPFSRELPLVFYGCLCLVGAGLVIVLIREGKNIDASGFRVFAYLLPTSIILYVISYYVLLRLFIPNRYMEFSLTIFYSVLLGVSIASVFPRLGLAKFASPLVLILIAVLGGVRNYNVSIYDYSRYEPLYRFIETLPKDSLIAGHPELMDNIQTFSRRKAFVTYELSHPYRTKYWALMKKRLFDFFDAYYSQDSREVKQFAAYYGIDYLVVRDDDFGSEKGSPRSLYFEPFGEHIRKLLNSRNYFALESNSEFEVVYEWEKFRVLKMGKGELDKEGSRTKP